MLYWCRPKEVDIMVAEIRVTPEIDITALLDAADEEPVVLERNGKRYRLAPEGAEEEDFWAGYDPEKARAALRATAGSWSDIDVDKLIAELYEARELGSRPWDRP
jgi:hypothetical protein